MDHLCTALRQWFSPSAFFFSYYGGSSKPENCERIFVSFISFSFLYFKYWSSFRRGVLSLSVSSVSISFFLPFTLRCFFFFFFFWVDQGVKCLSLSRQLMYTLLSLRGLWNSWGTILFLSLYLHNFVTSPYHGINMVLTLSSSPLLFLLFYSA